MERTPRALVAALIVFAVLIPVYSSAQVTRADYERATGLRAKLQPLALDIVDRGGWIGKSERYWYRKSVAGGNEYWIADTGKKDKAIAFDHARMAAAFETFSSGAAYNGCFVTFSNNDQEILQPNSAAGVLPAWDERAQNICAKSIGVNLPVFSNNLEILAYVNSSGLMEGYDTSTKLSLWRYQPRNRILALAVSPDGTIVAAGDETGRLVFLNGQTGEVDRDRRELRGDPGH